MRSPPGARSARPERRGTLCSGSRFGQLVEEPYCCTFTGPRRRRTSSSRPRPVSQSAASMLLCRVWPAVSASRPTATRSVRLDAWGFSSDPACCRPSCERAAPVPQQREGVLLPARRLVGARACVRGWWAWSIRLDLVQIETLTGVDRLASKIVQMIGGHGLSGEGRRRLVFPRADRQRRTSQRPMSILPRRVKNRAQTTRRWCLG
jgi:hypothetical protein